MSVGGHLIVAVYSGDSGFSGSTSTTFVQTVVKATPTITWNTPSAIIYGTALSATQLNASAADHGASIPGSYVYSPFEGTVLAAGTQLLSVTFTPTDSTNYNTANANVNLVVNKATLTVTAINASRWQGTANPIFTDIIIGFVNGDTSAIVSGVASFSTTAVTVSPVGTYPITVTAGNLSASNYTFSFVNGALIITAAAATQLAFTPLPAGGLAGTTLAAVSVSVEDSFGNLVTSDSSAVTLALGSGVFSAGSNSAVATAVNGVATFNNLVIDSAGSYTLTATDGPLAPTPSTSCTILPLPNSVNGHVFNDADNNGALAIGETGESAVNVTLAPTGATSGSPLTLATTGDGYYIFENVNPGTYSVSETIPSGYALTAPIGGSAAVIVLPGQPAIGPTFGNVLISSVIVNFNTLVALSQDYSKPGTFANGDLNGDGMVDFNDLVLLSQNYNQTLPAGVQLFWDKCAFA